MNAEQFQTFTFAAVGIPALLFACCKAWLALIMTRGTKVRTSIGIWLIRLYTVVALLTVLIGTAYLLTVSDQYDWIAHDFLRTRQVMRLMIGLLYLAGIVTAFKLWRNVQDLEERNAIRDAARDEVRDRERDIIRDSVRDESRDIVRDIHADIAKSDDGKDAT
jgi:hypothetical protein